jgi:hypothetical protein
VVSGIMESAGKPTIEEAQVINEDLGNSPGKFDSLFVALDQANS